MVLTRSKMTTTFVRLPRYGRITPFQKMELEETTIDVKDVKFQKKKYVEDNDDSCFTLLDDSDTRSLGSIESHETIFSTPKKSQYQEDITFSPMKPEEKEVNEYELQRQQRMKENLKALQDLGVSEILDIQNKVTIEKQIVNKKKREQIKRKRALRQRMNANKPKIRRTSPRLKNSRTTKYGPVELDFDISAIASMMKKTISKDKLTKQYFKDEEESVDDDDLLEEEKKEIAFVRSLEDRYYTCEEYFTLKGVKPKLIQENGKFIGWVEEGMRKKIGIAADKETAWESNGGGKFTFKTPTGKLRQAESAKETARKMLFKNPNSYFYRHTAPGLDHWQGDWTEPENERFLEVAKKYGVGNKWGLFATYIRNRVGYQCSNHYRAHFVEGGIIWDGNFMLDKYGKSIYVGRKNKYV